MIRLHDLGFGPKLSMAIYQFYQAETLNVLENNPYQLVYDIKGIGFNKADTLARNNGISFNDPERLKAGLLYTLEEECIKQGHTYLSLDYAIEVTLDMLMDAHSSDSIDSKQLENILELLHEEQKLL